MSLLANLFKTLNFLYNSLIHAFTITYISFGSHPVIMYLCDAVSLGRSRAMVYPKPMHKIIQEVQERPEKKNGILVVHGIKHDKEENIEQTNEICE